MSVENVRLLYQKVNADDKIQQRLKNFHLQQKEAVLKELIRLGDEHGAPFTADDFNAYITEIARQHQKEDALSEEELANVAGGGVNWFALSIITIGIACAAGVASSVTYKAMHGEEYVCEIQK